jgi:hypothetical protein
VAVAGIVVHDGQIPGSLIDQSMHELDRRTGSPETADHDGGAVCNIRHGILQRKNGLLHSILAFEPAETA